MMPIWIAQINDVLRRVAGIKELKLYITMDGWMVLIDGRSQLDIETVVFHFALFNVSLSNIE